VRTTRFWNNLHQVQMYAQYRNIGKLNHLIVFGSNKAKEPKQNSQNRLWSPMSKGEKLSFDHT